MRTIKLWLLVGTILAVLQMTPAFGQYPPRVEGRQLERPAMAPAPALVQPNQEIQPGGLAFTGAELTAYVVLGLGLTSAGYILVRRSRAHARD